WHTGTGYSPPARNEAVSPESAIRSGSARRRTRPFVSSAVRATSRLAPLLARLASATPKGSAPETKVPAVANNGRPGAALPGGACGGGESDPTGGAGPGFPAASTRPGPTTPTPGLPPGTTVPVPVVKPRFPPPFAPNQFTPSSRLAERSTSRK